MKTKVCHITSAHSSKDIRIFTKECSSLAEVGYEVYLVARGESEYISNVNIVGCTFKRNSRLYRMLIGTRIIYKKAVELNCDIYHIHDPELLRYAIKLKRKGKKVIFDSHEDVPSQILDKSWIPTPVRRIISKMYKGYETHVVKNISAVIAATPHIAEQFEGRGRKVVVVNNYPRLDDIKYQTRPFEDRGRVICYAGGISKDRGEDIMIEAMKSIDGTLLIAGRHEKKTIDFTSMGGGRVEYLGQQTRKEINNLYGRSICGLVLLKTTKAYVESLPIKMFEYMGAGIPYIASDFETWKKLMRESEAGVYTNVNDTDEVIEKIKYILNNPKKAFEMGKRGRVLIETTYNWNTEGEKLIACYDNI